MGPYGINRAVQRVDFTDCENGLGISVIGGYREQTEEECGIYVKRILPGGIAAQDGRLQAGDLILQVNGEDLEEATNERAVEILRMASASNHMSLMIARDDESRRLFVELMENYGTPNNASSSRSSPIPQTGKHLEGSSSSSSSPSPQLLSCKDIITNSNGASSPLNPSLSSSDPAVELICIAKETSLGLNIVGGTNRAEGPMVYVQEVVPGRDCHKDGRLRPGDQLMSINKESLVGITLEEAKSILTRIKLRSEPSVEITFIRGKQPPSPSSLSPSSPTGSDTAPRSPLLHPKASALPQPPSELTRASQATATSKRSAIMSQLGSPSENPGYVPSSRRQSCLPRGRRSSLTPSVRLKVEKLETALGYLGIETTEQQQQSLRQRIQVDAKGTVAYGDFVQGARDVFRLQLDEATSQGSVMTSGDVTTRGQTAEPVSQMMEDDKEEEDELERVKQERSDAMTQIKRLKEELSESERSRSQLSEELHRVTREAKSVVEECRALRGRIHVAEAAQRQARGMEMDYEEVIHLLEAEITELKAQLSEQHGQSQDDAQDLRKRVAVLDCQLRKSQLVKKTFEVSTEKLLNFVEVVHEVLVENPAALTSGKEPRRAGAVPGTVATLGSEAKELAKSIRAIIEADCLPYGWEEAFTADGIKYYINHVTQTTSWIHPVTSSLSGGGDPGLRDPPEFKR